MPNLTTIAEWAETLGISRQQGYAAIKRCEITVTDGKVDPEYATILYHRHTRKRANGNQPADTSTNGSTPSDANDYQAARIRREAAEASMAEMKEAEMRGKYLLKSDVDAVMFEIARAMRDGLSNCAKRLAADVANLTTSDECEAIIDREHRALLQSMTHQLKARLEIEPASEPEPEPQPATA